MVADFIKQRFLVDRIQSTNGLKDGSLLLYAHMPLNNVKYKGIPFSFQSIILLVISLFHLAIAFWLALKQHLFLLYRE